MTSAFDHPWLSGLFADPDTAALWSAEAQLVHMLAFEAAWSRAGPLAGLWSVDEGEAAAQTIESARIVPTDLAEGTGRDGVCIPDLVALLKKHAAAAGVTGGIHKGATSQDVIDTATAQSMVATLDLLVARMQGLYETLGALEGRFGPHPMMGRTRMQAATPITVADRVQTWRLPLADHLARAEALRPRIARVQIGGASGDRAALGANGQAMVDAVAVALGLRPTPRAWHSMRDSVAEFAGLLSLISGSLGKMGQDLCLMAQQGVGEVQLDGAGGSSAMPHKQNPVLAEALVTLARFNAVQVSGMHHAVVHEQERSGAAWSLEWMILPQMAQTTGRALTAALALVTSIRDMGGQG